MIKHLEQHDANDPYLYKPSQEVKSMGVRKHPHSDVCTHLKLTQKHTKVQKFPLFFFNYVLLINLLPPQQPREPMRMRSGCFERGSVLAGDRVPSEDASIKSTDTSSWPPT